MPTRWCFFPIYYVPFLLVLRTSPISLWSDAGISFSIWILWGPTTFLASGPTRKPIESGGNRKWGQEADVRAADKGVRAGTEKRELEKQGTHKGTRKDPGTDETVPRGVIQHF